MLVAKEETYITYDGKKFNTRHKAQDHVANVVQEFLVGRLMEDEDCEHEMSEDNLRELMQVAVGGARGVVGLVKFLNALHVD